MHEQKASRTNGVFTGALLIVMVGALSPIACGPTVPPGTGGAGGTAGTAGSAGSGGTAGPSGCSSASVGGGGQGGYTSQRCPDAPAQDLPLDAFPSCANGTSCMAAHCIPNNLIPASVDQNLLKTCDASSKCVPDDYAKPFGKFKVKKCTSLLNTEGRCISTCIPRVNGLMDVLPKADCGDYEVCAPCFDPNDGSPTGACTQGCDTGPANSTPYVFPKCQNGGGVCAPISIIPPILLTQLPQDVCQSGSVCAPIAKTKNLKYNFPSCQPSNPFVAVLAGFGPNNQTGGCVPQWLADANPIEGVFMAQDTCQTGEKCAPCNNPLRGFVPTGACPVPLCSDPKGGAPPATR